MTRLITIIEELVYYTNKLNMTQFQDFCCAHQRRGTFFPLDLIDTVRLKESKAIRSQSCQYLGRAFQNVTNAKMEKELDMMRWLSPWIQLGLKLGSTLSLRSIM